MKYIRLLRGGRAIVNNSDYDYLIQWQWHRTNNGYAARRIYLSHTKSKIIYMARVIAERMGLNTSNEIDHENRVKLDNRRRNLRSATRRQQSANHGKHENNSSGYRGVCWDKQLKKWRVQLSSNGKRVYQSLFDDLNEAARAYNKAAKKYFGKFAYLNPV